MTDFQRWFLAEYLKKSQGISFEPSGPTDSLLGYWSRMAGFSKPEEPNDFSQDFLDGWDEAEAEEINSQPTSPSP